jgi:catechol 2,3-dioxygenase-like lactoylglutathione lyase family enzyme
MTELMHAVQGVDYAAFPTFDPKATSRFYRDVLGFPVAHATCALGAGPTNHPDFIYFFFDIGQGDRIASPYYFGVEPYHAQNDSLIEIIRPLRVLTPEDDIDANLSVDALMAVVDEDEPSLDRFYQIKAELIAAPNADESSEVSFV